MKIHTLIFPALLLARAAHADPRTSADYALVAEVSDVAGGRASSADYTLDASVGGVTGYSTAPAEVARHGYIGQLYDLIGYALLASDYSPPEAGTTQLFPVRTADDGTFVLMSTAGFTFAALEGPIPNISATGLVDTNVVYKNTDAIIGATSPEFPGQIQLTLHVRDAIPDNYSTYAGDGLGDDWQVENFGLDNPLAAPGADADGTGQTNLFKYTAGLDPTDPNSRFVLKIQPGLFPNERRLIFTPRLPDRTYTIESRASLSTGQWTPLSGTTFTDAGTTRTVTDPNATTPARLYRVLISKP